MNYYYCDSCFIITSFQNDYLKKILPFKDHLFISKSQFTDELIKPDNIKEKFKEAITIIEENEEVIKKTLELKTKHIGLSYYDCLSLAFSMSNDYILITDDKALQNAARRYELPYISSDELLERITLGNL